MYLTQVSCHGILYGVSHLARAMTNLLKAHTGAAKHLLRYLTSSIYFNITYSQEGFKQTAFSDANWGNNLGSGKPT